MPVNHEVRGRTLFARYKKYINLFVVFFSKFSVKTRLRWFETQRNTRGKIGLGLRYALLKSIAHKCGDNVAIYPGVYILNAQNLEVGNNVSIHPMSYIECGKEIGGIQIDDDVSIAHGATIMATTHIYMDKSTCIKDQGIKTKPVHICQNVWIGAKATICAGITVASGCVIGANAVVTGNTQADMIYAGVPARVVKER